MLLVSEPVLGADEKAALAAVIAKATGWPLQVPLRRGLESTADLWSRHLSAKQGRSSLDFIT